MRSLTFLGKWPSSSCRDEEENQGQNEPEEESDALPAISLCLLNRESFHGSAMRIASYILVFSYPEEIPGANDLLSGIPMLITG